MVDDTKTERVLHLFQLIARIEASYLRVGMSHEETQGIALHDLAQCLPLTAAYSLQQLVPVGIALRGFLEFLFLLAQGLYGFVVPAQSECQFCDVVRIILFVECFFFCCQHLLTFLRPCLSVLLNRSLGGFIFRSCSETCVLDVGVTLSHTFPIC